MKLIHKSIFCLIGCCISFSVVFAQKDTEAKTILAAVSKKYRSYDVVKAEFTFNLKSPQTNVNETQKGQIYTKPKTNQYKVLLDEQELISDGKVQWTYLKQDKEVQISAVDHSNSSINPAQIFTIYEKGFKYRYDGESNSYGITYQNIELAPLSNQSFSKVKLRINKLKKQIASIVIYDKNGNIYTYVINSFIPNVKVSDTLFLFDVKKHPDVDVVDLR
jgi:outer membrane lipoprotein-sorting protein